MCLLMKDKITKDVKYGYKIFITAKDGSLKGLCFKGYYKKNKWYDAKVNKIQDNFFQEYDSGFHTFIDKKDAEHVLSEINSDMLIIKKVKLEEITATGTEVIVGKVVSKVVVAKRMYIC